jgi:hypothetical protein
MSAKPNTSSFFRPISDISFSHVIPAKAGIHAMIPEQIPAFAGMTNGYERIPFRDELAEATAEAKRLKVKLSPEMEQLIRENVRLIEDKMMAGKRLKRRDLAFLDTVKRWIRAEQVRLRFKSEYESLPPGIQTREGCTWEKVWERLLANNSKKLKLAAAMQGGGQLFGVDAEGRALFKDKGTEPVMFGYDGKGKLLKIYDRDPEQMETVRKWANYFEIRAQVRKDGYELFADDGNYRLSDEMKQVQDHTKEPFIASRDRKEWRISWLESGDRPGGARLVGFGPGGGRVYVLGYFPERSVDDCGAVRLLRV